MALQRAEAARQEISREQQFRIEHEIRGLEQ